jgi:mannitol-1-/sugar-/sorbitol-6-phosphatase
MQTGFPEPGRGRRKTANSMPDMFDAVLLDMDGTLVDSEAVITRTWAVWAAKYGLDLTAVLRYAAGKRDSAAMAELAPHLPPEQVAADSAEMALAELSDFEGVIATAGAEQLLRGVQASRVPWAIVTSAPRELAIARLCACALPCPEVLVTNEDVERGKPSPEGYLLAARLLNVKPERCVVIEDAHAGIQAAHSAGMTVIGTGPGTRDDEVAHHWVADLTELTVVRASTPYSPRSVRLPFS